MLGHFAYESLLIDSQDQIVAVYDADVRLVAIYGDYAKAERYGSTKAAEALGRTPEESMADSHATMLREIIERVIERQEPESIQGGFRIQQQRISFRADFSPLQTPEGRFTILRLLDISDQQDLLRELNQSDEHYRHMVEQALDVFMDLDLKGRVQYVSPNASRVLGHAPEKLLGIGMMALIHPDDRENMRQCLRSVIHRDESDTFVYRFHHGDGRWIWLEPSARRYRGADGAQRIGSVTRDVTKQVLALRKTEQSDRRYRILADSAFSLVAEVNETGEVLFVSPRFRERLGKPELIIGADFGRICHPDDVSRLIRIVRRILDGMPVEPFVTRFADGVGGWWYGELLGTVLANEDGRGRILIFGRDITDDLEEQEARSALEERLSSGELARGVADLATDVAHNLNNLLAIAVGSADMLKRELPTDSPAERRIEEIIRASTDASALSRQLGMIARGGETSQFETIDLVELVHHIEPLLLTSITPGSQLRLVLQRDPCWIDADASQLGQLLVTLVRNACKAIGDDGGEVTVSVAEAASGLEGERWVVLAVEDDGSGLDGHPGNRILAPDFAAQSPEFGQTVPRRITEAHGGVIRVGSPVGPGTRIGIRLPLLSLDGALAIQNEAGPDSGSLGRVLVADRDPAACKIASQLLAQAGYQAVGADHAAAVLELVAAEPDLVCALIDFEMWRNSPISFASEIRARRPQLPVIWLTGVADEPPAEAPNLETVRKPLQLETLTAKLQQAGVAPGSEIRPR